MYLSDDLSEAHNGVLRLAGSGSTYPGVVRNRQYAGRKARNRYLGCNGSIGRWSVQSLCNEYVSTTLGFLSICPRYMRCLCPSGSRRTMKLLLLLTELKGIGL